MRPVVFIGHIMAQSRLVGDTVPNIGRVASRGEDVDDVDIRPVA
jgi:hypothetical protein